MLFASQKFVLVMNRMLKMKKHALSFLTLTMALSSGAVFAVGGVGDQATQTANITFASTSNISNVITVNGSLTAGLVPATTSLATGVVTLSGDVVSHPTVAVTFVNGVKESAENKRVITKEGGGASITVHLKGITGDASTQVAVITNGISMHKITPTGTFNYELALADEQTVAAGNYAVQVAAQRWEL